MMAYKSFLIYDRLKVRHIWSLLKIASHLVSFAVNQSHIELFSQKSRHKDIVDKKILSGLKKKELSFWQTKYWRQMWCNLGSVDNLDGSGNIEKVEDAVAIVGVDLHLRVNFICSYFPVHKLFSRASALILTVRVRCL